MSEAVLLDQAGLDLRGLLTGLSLGQAVTLAETTGEPVALLVSLRKDANGHAVKSAKASVETEPWMAQWRELAEAIGREWPAGQSALEIKRLRSETLTELGEKARALGKSIEDYALELIEDGLTLSGPTFDEILAPIRQEVAESGITDEELDELFMEARRDNDRKPSGRPETESWLAQWLELAAAIGREWPAGQSAADVIAEMRR